MFRCVPRAPAATHAFAIAEDDYLPRMRYPTSLIARALIRLGEGRSYAAAAYEVRERAGRPESADRGVIVNWLERFGPAVTRATRREVEPGGTLMLDQLLFNVAALDAQGRPKPSGRLVFAVFGAAVQHGNGRLRVLELGAAPNKTTHWWSEFLGRVQADPSRIVADEDTAMLDAARARWPRMEVFICQWHLRHQAETLLVSAKRHGRRDPLYRALLRPFDSPQSWGRFKKLAEASGIQALDAWVTVKDDLVRRQLRRPVKPLTTGALETALREVKKMLILRRGSFEDFPRLNLALGLIANHLNRVDREPAYIEAIATT